jgi:type I restriction enzyme M protein
MSGMPSKPLVSPAVLNAEIAEIVKREDVLRAEIDRIIMEIDA